MVLSVILFWYTLIDPPLPSVVLRFSVGEPTANILFIVENATEYPHVEFELPLITFFCVRVGVLVFPSYS